LVVISVLGSPHFREKSFVGYRPTGVLHQMVEEAVLCRTQFDPFTSPYDNLTVGEVNG